jgi:hypothetical protein
MRLRPGECDYSRSADARIHQYQYHIALQTCCRVETRNECGGPERGVQPNKRRA